MSRSLTDAWTLGGVPVSNRVVLAPLAGIGNWFLRIHPDEHPVAIQLFGHDPDVMREAAAIVAATGADLIDINMGCPVKKVCKTGAGASLLDDQDKAVALAKGAVDGANGKPVTVK